MQLSIFENAERSQIELSELFKAYVACRKNKRHTANALALEIDYERLQKWNEHILEKKKPDEQELLSLQSSVNSYLALLQHYQTYRLRKNRLLRNLSAYYLNHFYLSGG